MLLFSVKELISAMDCVDEMDDVDASSFDLTIQLLHSPNSVVSC